MAIIWYDRQGKPFYDFLQIEEKLGDPQYRRVAETFLNDGTWVSTVWLGIDHNFSRKGPPLIFETMVFSSEESPLLDMDCDRYPTEREAAIGHREMVDKWERMIALRTVGMKAVIN